MADLFDDKMWIEINNLGYNAILMFLNLCSEDIIIKAIELKKFNLNQDLIFKNKLFRPINIFVQKNMRKVLEYILENKLEIELDYYVDLSKHENYKKYTCITLCNSACVSTTVWDTIELLDKLGVNFKKIDGQKYWTPNIESESLILFLMEKQNITLDNEIFYSAVKNNWIKVIDYYFAHGIIDWKNLNGFEVITGLLYNEHYYLAYKVYSLVSKIFISNVEKGLDWYYLNPDGYYMFDDDDNNNDNENNKTIPVEPIESIEPVEEKELLDKKNI